MLTRVYTPIGAYLCRHGRCIHHKCIDCNRACNRRTAPSQTSKKAEILTGDRGTSRFGAARPQEVRQLQSEFGDYGRQYFAQASLDLDLSEFVAARRTEVDDSDRLLGFPGAFDEAKARQEGQR